MIQRRNAASAKHRLARNIRLCAARCFILSSDGNLVSQLLDPATGQLTGAPLNIATGMTIAPVGDELTSPSQAPAIWFTEKVEQTRWHLPGTTAADDPVTLLASLRRLPASASQLTASGWQYIAMRTECGDLEFLARIWTKLSDGWFGPAWSPDNRADCDDRGRAAELVSELIDSNRGVQRLNGFRESQVPRRWSSDGRYVALSSCAK